MLWLNSKYHDYVIINFDKSGSSYLRFQKIRITLLEFSKYQDIVIREFKKPG